MTVSPVTRKSLHAVAEHVMATAQYAAIGKIGLRPHPGGFKTQDDQLLVADGELNGVEISGRTLRDLGGRDDVALPYTPLTPFDDEPLRVEAAECRALGDFYTLVDAALHAVKPDEALVQIWPEHFDIACDFAQVNYGGSPGDDAYPDGYLYVGPWDRTRHADQFDDPWGLTRHARDVGSVDDAIAFFQQGKHLFG